MRTVTAALIAIPVLLIFWVQSADAQSAKDAVMGLKKLQAHLRSGTSYRDYSNQAAEARFPVDLYLSSSQMSSQPDLAKALKKTLGTSDFIGMLWSTKIKRLLHGIQEMPDATDPWIAIVLKDYPEANRSFKEGGIVNEPSPGIPRETVLFDLALSFMFTKLSQEIDAAAGLYAQLDAKGSPALSDLQTEIMRLRKENEDLRRENATLKKKKKSQ